MFRRANTFRIDYATIIKKPNYDEVHKFIFEKLGLKREEVQRIHCSRYNGCAFITVNDLDTAIRVVEEHDSKHEIEADGKQHIIRISMVDGSVEVKLYDLSVDVKDEVIAEFLRAYGDVFSMYEKLWDSKYVFGGIPSGIRVVKMLVKKNIPSVVTIDGETTLLSYHGQKQTCRHCSEFVHNGITCIMNKKLLIQKLATDQKNSFASVTKNTIKSVTKPEDLKTKLSSKTSEPKPSTSKTGSKHSEEEQSLPKPKEQKQQKKIPAPTTTAMLRSHQHISEINSGEPDVQVVTDSASKIPQSQKPISGEDLERVESSETDESIASNGHIRLRTRKPPLKGTRNDGGDDTQVEKPA